MKNTYFLLLLAWLIGHTAQAQTLGYAPALSLTQAGTYTDLGTTGTAIATANTDDANSTAQAIGFSFEFDGTTYTQFILNTNGFIKLGTVAPATAAAFQPYAQLGSSGPVDNTSLTDLVLPFNTDLMSAAGAAAEYRVATTGTAPNRVCTVQWKNVADKPRPTTSTNPALVPAQLASFSFQLKLYEADRHIAFVYGPATASSAASTYSSGTVGLKGAGTGSGQLLLATKNSGVSWSGTTFVDTPYTGTVGHNLRNVALPDAGRTYTFSIPTANDAAVAEIHALGTVLTPGAPQSVDVVVRNTGTATFTGATVTLTITGANTVTALTQPTGTLGVGADATLTFSGLSLPVAGANTITASLPADGNTANDALAQPLITSASAISYIVGSAGATGGGYGLYPSSTGITGAFLARFSLGAPRTITSVQAYLTDYPATSTQTSTVGQVVYGVVRSLTTGAVIARSPDYVVTSADINTTHTFVLSTPVALPAGDFLAGMAQVQLAGGLQYYPMGIQVEVPARPNLFYTVTNIQGTAAATAFLPSDGLRLMLGVTTSAVLATTPARTLALSVYPNPSATGDFTLDASGLNAPAGLQLEVVSQLGQRVYSGTARAAARTVLPLAGLAPGLYTLRVKSGTEQTQQQLCIAP